jgi:hypothetical protein
MSNPPQKLKILLTLLIISAVAGQSLIYPTVASAQTREATLAQAALRCAGIGLGTVTGELRGLAEGLDPSKVPVRDSATRSEIRSQSCEQFKDKALEVLSQTLREILKKRILDSMVDQTIQWIQGGGEPRFVTDFGGFLEDAGQAAVGDVALEVGLGNLCTGISPARIRFQLETPVFSQRVSCTLDDITGNIDQFRRSFTAGGGWVTYQELLKPQNNQWGVEILTRAEVERRTAQKQDVLRQEIAVGSGFLSTTQCLEWTRYGTSNGRTRVIETRAVNDSFDFRNPSSPPSETESGETWQCTRTQVSTPGRLIADATTNALNIHSNFIVSADDLSDYAAAIIDAGVNRLIKEGFKGILGVPVSAPPSGFTSDNIPSNITDSAADYTDTRSEQGGTAPTSQELLSTLDRAETALENALNLYEDFLEINENASTTAQSLLDWCRLTTTGDSNASEHPQSCAAASQTLNETQTNETNINQGIEIVNQELAELAPLRAAAQNPPTDSDDLRELVEEIAAFASGAAQLESAATNQFLTIQGALLQINNFLNACTDDDETTQCP